jgi:aspartyl-tRNA(Asn)/glutamyl-tRNA(Gln) amidotransferase subunit A
MLERLTLREALAAIQRGDFEARALTAALLARIEALDSRLNAYTHIDAGAAAAAEPAGAGAALRGLPFTLKDNMSLAGTPTACASRILAGYLSPFDCTAAARLREAGGRYLGKTNMDEFAMGSSTEFSCRGPAHNPWDLTRTAGGSSGGAAAAVAADLALFALGSDTGGSIRQPAALCGVVGVKPTYGRVSRYGLVAYASSLDQIGPITKDVADAALVLELIMGRDASDASSLPARVPSLTDELSRELKGLRVGVPEELGALGMDAGDEAVLEAAIAALAAEGAERVSLSLPHLRYALAAYYLIAPAEASSNLARYDGIRYGLRAGEDGDLAAMLARTRSEGFGPEVKRRILLGTFALSAGYHEAYYRRAQQVRTLIRRDFAAAFERCDVIVMPATPGPAFPLGERSGDPLALYLSDIYTLPANLAGLPAASVPTALRDGLPLGTQIMTRPLDEATLIRAAAGLERAFPFRALRAAGVDAALGAQP